MAGAEKRRGRSGFYVPKCLAKWYTSKLYGELQPFLPEDNDYRLFKHISLDWITGLPDATTKKHR